MKLSVGIVVLCAFTSSANAFLSPNIPTTTVHKTKLSATESLVLRTSHWSEKDDFRIQRLRLSLPALPKRNIQPPESIHGKILLPVALVASLLSNFSSVANAASTITAGTSVFPIVQPSISSWQLLFAASLLLTHTIGTNVANLAAIGLANAGSWYMTQLVTFPVITKSITAAVIGFLGDYMAQWLEYNLRQGKSKVKRVMEKPLTINGSYDFRRGMSTLTDSIFISGPLMHFAYELFEKILPIASGTGTASTFAAFTHVLADSVLLDSIFVATTFLVTGMMEGYKWKDLRAQMKTDYIPALKASWVTSVIVMPIELVCFRCLPLSFRVLAVNFIDVIWDAVISFMAHRSRHNRHVTRMM